MKILPSCKPSDWVIKIIHRQPRWWEGTKISVDDLIDRDWKSCDWISKIQDAIAAWRAK